MAYCNPVIKYFNLFVNVDKKKYLVNSTTYQRFVYTNVYTNIDKIDFCTAVYLYTTKT